VNRLFYKVLDQNTIIIVPESRQKRQSYDELLLRTFYVQNAEINDTVNMVKTLAKVQTVVGNQALNAITVLGTLDQLAMAERVIDSNDKARGEVVVEVRILEVNRLNSKQWGIDLSNYTAAATLSPTGVENEITAGLLNIRAHLLSSLNQSDWVVSLPSTVFARFFQDNDSNVRILASPRLRAAEGKKAELKIGTEVPIPVTSYTVGTGGTTGYLPATSFQYRNVGVNLTLTPRVSATGDITLELTAEFSLLGDDRNVGSADNPITVPTFLSRNVNGTLRLRDGETGLIGGLLQGRDARSFSGAIGVNKIPVIGKLFGNNQRESDQTEVLISITPRIVRAPKVTEEDMVPLRVGTQEVPRVEGLRGSLFGEPEPSIQPPNAATAPPSNGAAQPAPRPLGAAPPPAATVAPAPPTQQVIPPGPAVTPPGAGPDTPAVSPAASPDARPANAILSPPEVVLQVGQTGAIAVVVVGARDVMGIDMSLVWDATLAKVTDIAAGSLLSLEGVPVSAERGMESGRARVRFSRASGVTGSGAVAAITLRGLKAGSGSIVVESLALVQSGGTTPLAPPAPGRLAVAP
jgi:general secretion pathway protein D